MNTTLNGILDGLGLEKKRTTTDILLPSVALFSAGLLVGAGLGLLFAPKPGRELRHDVSNKFHDLRNRARKAAEDVEEEMAH